MSHPIVLFDGVCGLCNRFVQFVLRHDSSDLFRFAPLQSALAAGILARHGVTPQTVDTTYVVQYVVQNVAQDPGPNVVHNSVQDGVRNSPPQQETLLTRSDAVLFVLEQLGGIWRLASRILGLLPRTVRDFAYNAIARRRYAIFGRSESCILPNPKDRDRFLDS
jgi:predicted DCC family thiol-disulfide oxidoreductase YuxK